MELHRPWSPSKWAFFVLALSFSARWWAAESTTDDNDLNALHALQHAWGQMISKLEWIGNDPCGAGWTGVTCDSSFDPQRVTSIQLPGLGLAGVLPPDIGHLNALLFLDLSYNNLTGSLPSQIGKLTHLSELYLQFNYFNGRIPTEIGQLKNLSFLFLNGNLLTEGIPHEIGLLEKLNWLDLAQNQLEGSLPYSSDGNSIKAGLDNLTKAKHFHLNNNSFHGTIPESMCHPGMSLLHLLLDSNHLAGTIPGGLGSCGSLTILKLDNNLLGGTIPDQIGQLINLTGLQLSDNQLVGPLPDLSNLTKLGVLELSNNSLDVEFPLWILSLKSLTDMIMQRSSVRGQIPPSLFQLQALSEVKLGNNIINGTLDMSMATGHLLLLSMENNSITTFTFGNHYVKDLRLQGNPVCTGENSPLSPKVCFDISSVSAQTTYGNSTTCFDNICPSGYQVNPLQCKCAVPYQGKLIYRAPSFTSLSNTSRIPTLVAELAKKLSVDQQQVQVSSADFNDRNQLIVVIAIFPSDSVTIWSVDDVLRMSRALDSKNGVSPNGFGPPMFQLIPYDFTPLKNFAEVIRAKGSGLSTVANICIGIGAALLLLVILGVGCFACLQKRRADKAVELSKPFGNWGRNVKDSGNAPQLKGTRFFSYAELKKATNNFSESNEIGSGGYGKVYRGIISNGEQVAVKRAQGNSMQGSTEFKNEIELLSRVHHKNVVSLVGFCFQQGEQMLVYEYMAGGSLRDCLVGRSGVKLDWRRRIMIALGAARGIAYLHELANPPIIHRDIKSSNILLDEKKIAKVADFGLSKIGPGEGSGKQQISTLVKGTLGYLDPEYYISHELTEKSDVYSYGVVLLELLTSRAPIEHEKYVVKEVKMAMNKGGLGELRSMLDPRLTDEELAKLNAFVCIALSCVEDSAASRPSMGEVVKQLEELVGPDYPESESSNIDLREGHPIRNAYGSDSDYLHTSRDSSDPSFTNSASYIPPSFWSR